MVSPEPGMLITPSLRLERPFARGGMGAVWLAEHLGLRTKVVVKFLVDELAANAEAVARFTQEAAAASQVKSPHVVQMIDHGVTDGGLAYIAMERLEGYSLGAHLEREPVVEPRQAALVIGQAAKALAKAHEAKVIHRDIKPDNLFLCDDGGDAFVKVLDFGIAKVAGVTAMGATRTGAMMGTVYYMSPEQIMGDKNLDHGADIWALAVVSYELLCGTKPFDGETVGAMSVAICSAKYVDPTARNASLPAAVDAVMLKAFSLDITARYPTVRGFADALSEACGGLAPLRLLVGAHDPVSSAAMLAHSPTEHAVESAPASVQARAPAPAVATRSISPSGTAAMPGDGFKPKPTTRRNAYWLTAGVGAALVVLVFSVSLALRGSTSPQAAGVTSGAIPGGSAPAHESPTSQASTSASISILPALSAPSAPSALAHELAVVAAPPDAALAPRSDQHARPAPAPPTPATKPIPVAPAASTPTAPAQSPAIPKDVVL